MNKLTAIKTFESEVYPNAKSKKDRIKVRTIWNDYVDTLNKNGDITDKQASKWISPY